MKNKLPLTKTFPRETADFYSALRGSIQHMLPWGGRLHPRCSTALFQGLCEHSVSSDP